MDTCASQAGSFIPRLQQQSWFHLLFGKGKLTSSFATLSSMITFHKLNHISDVMMLGHLVDPLVFNVLWVEAYPYIVYVLYIQMYIYGMHTIYL